MPEIKETMTIEERPAPIALPQRVSDARRFAHWGKLSFLLVAFLFLLAAGYEMMRWMFWHHFFFPVWIIYYGVGLVLSFLGAFMVQTQIIKVIDQGRFHDAKSNTLVWMIVGFICFALPGLILFFAFINLEEHERPAPQPAPVAPASPPPAPAIAPGQTYAPPSPPPVQTPQLAPAPATGQPYTPPPPPPVQTAPPAVQPAKQ
jgi:uncharacterized protein with PQ loop repeat